MAAAVATNAARARARPRENAPSARVWLDPRSVLPSGRQDYWRYDVPKNF
jgi:hypothetical protein